MHVLAVPLFRDATGVAVVLTAWARHRCLQLYLGPKPVRRRALLFSKGLLFFFFFFFFSTFRVLLGALTCSKTLENLHTRWNPRPSGRRRGWDPGVAQGLYGAPWNTVRKLDV